MILRLCLSMLVTGFLLTACVTIDPNLPDWDKARFFDQAQTAMENRTYKKAISLYEVYMVRFPEDRPGRIAAQYEIGFIHYKTGELNKAEDIYTDIIEQFNSDPYAALFHPRYKVLCQIGLDSIKKDRFVNNNLFWRLREKAWKESEEAAQVSENQ